MSRPNPGTPVRAGLADVMTDGLCLERAHGGGVGTGGAATSPRAARFVGALEPRPVRLTGHDVLAILHEGDEPGAELFGGVDEGFGDAGAVPRITSHGLGNCSTGAR